jgi:hypothetical protein
VEYFKHEQASDNTSVQQNCSYILLNATEYRILPDGTLELVDSETFFNASEYIVQGDKVYLCVSYTQNYTRKVNETLVTPTLAYTAGEAIASTIGLVVSLLALLLTAFVYSTLKQLRNIPGRNLLSLVCALLVANALFLAAPYGSAIDKSGFVCLGIGGVMHYFFLASFVWMNVMAVDVWFTFSNAFVKAGDRGKSSKRFYLYSAYAWLAPLTFVAPAITLQVSMWLLFIRKCILENLTLLSLS